MKDYTTLQVAIHNKTNNNITGMFRSQKQPFVNLQAAVLFDEVYQWSLTVVAAQFPSLQNSQQSEPTDEQFSNICISV